MADRRTRDEVGARRSGRLAAVAALVALVVLGGVPAAGPAGAVDPAVVVTEAGAREHLEALAAIADTNGGTRAAGTPGYDASVAYVSGRLAAAGYDVQTTPVPLDIGVEVRPTRFERTAPSARTYVEGTDYVQPLPAARTAVTADLHAIDDACDPDSYLVAPPGALLLITLSSACSAYLTAALAGEAQAAGALLVAEGGAGAPPERVDLGELPILLDLPVLSLSGDAGGELRTLVGGGTVTAEVDTGWEAQTVEVPNVVAELPGTTDEVVVVGAHLDSVPEGPGINDDGSGVAALLEIAEGASAAGVRTERGVRFAFWAAEEEGLLGSTAYLGSLGPAEVDRIVAYLNADMIGSPNGVRFTYDPATAELPETVSPGSAALTERFAAWFDAQGLPYQGTWSNGRSDDAAFAVAGIPVGGLYTGAEEIKTPEQAAVFGGTAGVPLDPCYHQACDGLSNVDVALTAQMGTALAAVAFDVAVVLPPAPAPAVPSGGATPVAAAPRFTG